jgi:hypothetical protein
MKLTTGRAAIAAATRLATTSRVVAPRYLSVFNLTLCDPLPGNSVLMPFLKVVLLPAVAASEVLNLTN